MFSCFYEVRGITLWPFIFLAEGFADDRIVNHERIHIHQANECLVVGMYVVWLFDFVRGFIVFGDARTSYLHNRLRPALAKPAGRRVPSPCAPQAGAGSAHARGRHRLPCKTPAL
jgi:hypothetical protein